MDGFGASSIWPMASMSTERSTHSFDHAGVFGEA